MEEDAKQRIVREATRLFAERGYDGTSIQALADAAGLRGPSLLYHYKSKAELREAVLDDLLGHWKDELPRLLAAANSGTDRLESAMRALLGFFGQRPERAQLLLRELLDRPEAMRQVFAQHLQPWTTLLTDYIRLGQAEGRVRHDLNPEAYVLHLISAGIGAVATGEVTAALFPEGSRPCTEARLTELVRLARAGLFTPRPH